MRGEIRDLSRARSPGHVYFTLTDPDGDASLGVMLSATKKGSVNDTLTRAGGSGADERRHRRADPRPARLVRAPRPAPAADDGDRPRLHARPARAGPGRAARPGSRPRGCCEPTPRTPLPLAPLRVGLVTSEGSAAEADFLDELRRSGFAFQVLRADSRVQGFDAPRSHRLGHPDARHPPARRARARARRRGPHRPGRLRRRGGGAGHRGVPGARCSPGVGHEVDTSVADEVAHTVGQDAHRVRAAARGAGRRAGRRARGHVGGHRRAGRAHRAAPRRAAACPRPPPGARHPRRARRRRGAARRRSPTGPDAPRWRPRPGDPPPRRPPRPHHRRGPVAPAGRRGARGRRRAPGRPPGAAGAGRGRAGARRRSRPGCAPSTPIAPSPAAGRSPAGPTARSSAPPPTCSPGDPLTTRVAGGDVRSTVSPDG